MQVLKSREFDMKQLFIFKECIGSSNNGVGTYIKQLILLLSDFDVSINILCFNSKSDFFSIEKKENITYFYFPSFNDKRINSHALIIEKFFRLYIRDSVNNIFLFNYSPSSLLMKTIRKSHPLSMQIYVIHDMGWTTHLFGDVQKYICILKQYKEKKISRKHSAVLDSFLEEIEMCRHADRIISLSEDTFNLLTNYYPIQKDKLFLIPNVLIQTVRPYSTLKKKNFKEKKLFRSDEKIILYVGRMVAQKGIFVYIEAFKEIVKEYPHCKLVIVGPPVDFNNMLKKCYPILTHIHFTGLISFDELKKWYEIADMGILPSYTEQCSFVGLEMMAHKIPIIASDGFGVRCMFNEQNAKIARIGNRSSIKYFKNELIKSTVEILSLLNNKNKDTITEDIVIPNTSNIVKVKLLYKNCFNL